MPSHTKSERAKKIRRAISSVAKGGINILGRAGIAASKVINRGLAGTAAVAERERMLSAKKRAAKKKDKKKKLGTFGGIKLLRRGK